MKRIGFIFILIVGINFSVFSQDIHSSQFYAFPMQLNPATTGFFPGDFRAVVNYKDQWRSIANPYQTAYASFDMTYPIKRLGLGVDFFHDRAGKSKMGIFQGNLSSAYILRLNPKNAFSGGLKVGFAQRSVSYDNLAWGNQFDGSTYNSSLPSGENSGADSFNYIDAGAGLMYTNINTVHKSVIRFGAAVHHVHQPRQYFYSGGDTKLYRKYVAHGDAQIWLKKMEHFFLLPQAMISVQGPFKEILAGAMLKYVIGEETVSEVLYTYQKTSSAIYFGGMYRVGDAFVLTGGYEYQKSWYFGLSYDLNISPLTTATYGRGGGEIVIRYQGRLYSD